MTTSHKTAEKFVKELERRTKAEEYTKKALEKVSGKYQELLAKRRKAAKIAAAKKAAAAKKQAAAKRAAAKKSSS